MKGKLKSRRFWLSIIVIAYAAIMGIRSLTIENDTIVTLVCIAAAAVAGIAYVVAESMVDEAREENDTEIVVEDNDEGAVEG